VTPYTHYEDRVAGVIATLTDGHVMHAHGTKRAAMAEVAAECDRRGVMIQTISTPNTIEGDLRGVRDQDRGKFNHTPSARPEAYYAALVGRRDLVAKL